MNITNEQFLIAVKKRAEDLEDYKGILNAKL